MIGNKAEQYLGEAMTYSLFEFVKEKEEEFTKDLPDTFTSNSDVSCGDTTTKVLKEKVLQYNDKLSVVWWNTLVIFSGFK